MDWRQLWEICSAPDNVPIVGLIPLLVFYIYLAWKQAKEFVQKDGTVYHTYSSYARGLDGLWGAYQWLDRAPLGRNEEGGIWWRRHDEYRGP